MRELDLARADGRERAVAAHEKTIAALDTIIEGLQELESSDDRD